MSEEMIREQAARSIQAAAIETEEFNLIALLKPRVFIDGNQWCVLWGENLHDGIAGFGASPILAVYDFNKAWHKKLPSSVNDGNQKDDNAPCGECRLQAGETCDICGRSQP